MSIRPLPVSHPRTKILGLAAVVAASITVVGARHAKATSSEFDVEQEAEVQKLALCYARGTDAIGRGDVALGKSTYAGCFTPDARLAVWFPGTPFDGEPTYKSIGTDPWADFASAVFTSRGYTATQHVVTNVEVHVQGNTATMTSYLVATHALANGTYDAANGMLEDEVVRVNGKWKIKTRTQKLITFTNAGTPTD